MQDETTDPLGRKQEMYATLDAPVETVWEAWTKPGHIQHWWGPDGFTNTIEKMEVEAGGEWIFTMHGPDGTAYPNRTIFREVVEHERLVHEHFNPNFLAVIEFEKHGTGTRLHWRKLYETVALFELVEKQHKASEGLVQTVRKLAAYLGQASGTVSIVTIDPSLNALTDKILFPEKLATAEELLKTARLPGKK